MADKKYQSPGFLMKYNCDDATYTKWLSRKANTHLKRDKKRWGAISTREEYKQAIHQAVIDSEGIDCYTGKKLNWELISQYNNDDSKKEGSVYKEKFANLPTVDHTDIKNKKLKFKICSWKVNDAKNDLDYKDFVKLCREVVEYSEKK